MGCVQPARHNKEVKTVTHFSHLSSKIVARDRKGSGIATNLFVFNIFVRINRLLAVNTKACLIVSVTNWRGRECEGDDFLFHAQRDTRCQCDLDGRISLASHGGIGLLPAPGNQE